MGWFDEAVTKAAEDARSPSKRMQQPAFSPVSRTNRVRTQNMPEKVAQNRPVVPRQTPLIEHSEGDILELVPDSRQFETFEAWINATLETLNLSITQLSLAAGLHFLTLRNIVRYRPSASLAPKTRKALMSTLGISAEELERLRPSQALDATRTAGIQRFWEELRRRPDKGRAFLRERGRKGAAAHLANTTAEERTEWARKRQQGQREKYGSVWPISQHWVEDWVETIDSSDPFVTHLRDAIVQCKPTTLAEVAAIIKVPKGKIHTWLGLGESRRTGVILRPRLHHLPGVAHFIVGDDPNAIEAEINHLLALMGKEQLAPAGLFIMRKLWELGKSARWLRTTAGGTKRKYRYIHTGMATKYERTRVADALDLSAVDRAELFGRTQDPPPRDIERTKETLKRNRNLKEGRAAGRRAQAKEAIRKYHATIDALDRAGKPHSIRGIVNQSQELFDRGLSSHTVMRLLQEDEGVAPVGNEVS